MSIRITDELTKIGFTENEHPAGIMTPGSTPFAWCAIFTIADNRSGASGNRIMAALDGLFHLHHNATSQRIRVSLQGTSAPTDLFTTNFQSGGDTLENTLVYAAGNIGFGGTPVANLMTRGVGIAAAQNSQNLGSWAADTAAVNRLRVGGTGASSTMRTQIGDYILFFLRSTEITFAEFSAWDLSDIFGLWDSNVTWGTLHATPTGPEDGGGGASGDGALIGDPVLARRLCVYRPDADASLIRNAAVPDFNNPSDNAVFIDPYEEYPSVFARPVTVIANPIPDPPTNPRISPIVRAIATASTASQIGGATAKRVMCSANSRGSKGSSESTGRDWDQNFASGSAAALLARCVGSFNLPANPSGTRRMPGFPGQVARYSSGGAKFTDAGTGGSLKRSFPLSTLAPDGNLCEGWLLRAGDVIENLYWIEPGSGMEASDTLRCEALVIEYPAAASDEVRIYGVESATRGVQGSELTGIEETVEIGTTPVVSHTALAGDTKSTTALTTSSDLSAIVGQTDIGVRVIRAATGSHHCAQVESATFNGVNYTVTLRDALPNAIATNDVLHFGPVTARLLTLEIPAANRSQTYFGMGIEAVSGLAPLVSHGGVSVKPGVAFAPCGQGGTGYVEQTDVAFPGLIGKCASALAPDVVLFCPAQQQADPEDIELFLAELTSDGADFERAYNPAWQHQSDTSADWQDYAFSVDAYVGAGANENLLAVAISPFDVMGDELAQLIGGDASDDGTHPSARGMIRGMTSWWEDAADAALPRAGGGGGARNRSRSRARATSPSAYT